jgi:myo-inositol-1(or 4)-monophosphatase
VIPHTSESFFNSLLSQKPGKVQVELGSIGRMTITRARELKSMEHELRVLVDSLTEAGRHLLHTVEEGFAVHTKSDHSPVTTADLEVNHLIHEAIRRHFPDDGWLSEEEPDDLARLQKKRVWILDPIDGTRAFIKKVPQFCIAAALIENGHPVVAGILNPATGELFTAIRGGGIRLTRDTPVALAEQKPERPVVLVNPSELQAGRFCSLAPHIVCRPIGSIAYALALVAAGRADAAVMLTGGNEWDVAAGVLLVEESGGTVTDTRGRGLRFNQNELRLHGAIAVGPHTDPSLITAIKGLTQPIA